MSAVSGSTEEAEYHELPAAKEKQKVHRLCELMGRECIRQFFELFSRDPRLCRALYKPTSTLQIVDMATSRGAEIPINEPGVFTGAENIIVGLASLDMHREHLDIQSVKSIRTFKDSDMEDNDRHLTYLQTTAFGSSTNQSTTYTGFVLTLLIEIENSRYSIVNQTFVLFRPYSVKVPSAITPLINQRSPQMKSHPHQSQQVAATPVIAPQMQINPQHPLAQSPHMYMPNQYQSQSYVIQSPMSVAQPCPQGRSTLGQEIPNANYMQNS